MNGAELFVRELQQREVSFIPTLCGHGMDPLDAACRDAGMRLVDVRNEQAAGYMAEVTGRLSRRVGVCAVSSGVAHANALTGVLNAHFDGAPMVLVTGCGPTETIGLGHFQDFDQAALAAPVCKYARTIDRPERIPQILHEAFTAALSGRPGPVHLTLPLDIQTAEVDPDRIIRVLEPAASPPVASSGAPESVAAAADLLSRAERPLLIAGSGLYYAQGEDALTAFVRTFSVPVAVPIWDRGSVPHPIDEFMGVIGAATGGPRLLPDADLVLMVGAACDYRVGYLQPPAVGENARIVRIHADPVQLQQGAGAHLSILGDPRSVLIQLADACACLQRGAPVCVRTRTGRPRRQAASPKTAWLQEARSRRDAFRQRCLGVSRPDSGACHSLDIIDAVQSVLTDDTVVLIDGGNIGQWAHQALCDHYPGHWVTCGASGVVGYGLPGAMAARLLYPDRPVILISGDGALTFTVAEFETAARQNLGFVVLLADDEAWGITLTGHQKRYGQGITSELGPIRFDQMAEAFGALGIRVNSPDEIAPALQQGLTADVPTLIHVPVIRSNPADP